MQLILGEEYNHIASHYVASQDKEQSIYISKKVKLSCYRPGQALQVARG
jgi:hypothetical protein